MVPTNEKLENIKSGDIIIFGSTDLESNLTTYTKLFLTYKDALKVYNVYKTCHQHPCKSLIGSCIELIHGRVFIHIILDKHSFDGNVKLNHFAQMSALNNTISNIVTNRPNNRIYVIKSGSDKEWANTSKIIEKSEAVFEKQLWLLDLIMYK